MSSIYSPSTQNAPKSVVIQEAFKLHGIMSAFLQILCVQGKPHFIHELQRQKYLNIMNLMKRILTTKLQN